MNINLKNEGLAAIVIPIMIPQGARVESNKIQPILELFNVLTISYAGFDHSKVIPKILIVFTNYDPDYIDSDPDSGDELMDMAAYIKQIRDMIAKNIYNDFYEPSNQYHFY